MIQLVCTNSLLSFFQHILHLRPGDDAGWYFRGDPGGHPLDPAQAEVRPLRPPDLRGGPGLLLHPIHHRPLSLRRGLRRGRTRLHLLRDDRHQPQLVNRRRHPPGKCTAQQVCNCFLGKNLRDY